VISTSALAPGASERDVMLGPEPAHPSSDEEARLYISAVCPTFWTTYRIVVVFPGALVTIPMLVTETP